MLSQRALAASRVGRLYGRRYASGAGAGDYFSELKATRAHAAETTNLWRRISFLFCVPATFGCIAWVLKVESEHSEHLEHIKHDNGGELPPTPEYPYLNKRAKPFPWGMNSLFFNPHSNKDMSEA